MTNEKCRLTFVLCQTTFAKCSTDFVRSQDDLGEFCPIMPHITVEIVLSDKSLARDALVQLRQRSYLQIASISVAPVQTILFRLGLDHEL